MGARWRGRVRLIKRSPVVTTGPTAAVRVTAWAACPHDFGHGLAGAMQDGVGPPGAMKRRSALAAPRPAGGRAGGPGSAARSEERLDFGAQPTPQSGPLQPLQVIEVVPSDLAQGPAGASAEVQDGSGGASRRRTGVGDARRT